MVKKTTTQEFKNQLHKIWGNQIVLVGEYINTRSKVTLYCKKHNIKWRTLPDKRNILLGCSECRQDLRQKEFQEKLNDKYKNNIILEDSYNGIRGLNKFKCIKHSFAWNQTPLKMLNGFNCPKCREEILDKYNKNICKIDIENNELWKTVPDHRFTNYEISNKGRVRSKAYIDNAGILHGVHAKKLIKKSSGYIQVILYQGNSFKTYKVHQLVAKAFIPNPSKYPIINHKDEDKANNCCSNLEWCTYSYNSKYRGIMHISQIDRQKSVIQKSKNGDVVKTWQSINSVKLNGYDPSSVSKCCRGKIASYRGFYWDYLYPNKSYRSKTGIVGIYNKETKTNPYIACIQVNNQKIILGHFSNLDDAKKARYDAETKYGYTHTFKCPN